jgi:hypothetical protein
LWEIGQSGGGNLGSVGENVADAKDKSPEYLGKNSLSKRIEKNFGSLFI